MAESTLAVTFADLKSEVGHFLGYGRTEGSWATEQAADVAAAIKAGLRQFYFPPQLYSNEQPYKWRFLTPVVTLVTIAPYSTGTIAITNGATTVTQTGGTWPSWTATNGSLIVDGTEYVIASRTDDDDIELASAWPEDTETAAEFVLRHNGNYDLPDDFGDIIGNMVVESDNFKPDIVQVGEGRIRSLRQSRAQSSGSGSTLTPTFYAIRPKEHTTTTTGQRFEIMFYPLPNEVLTISYRKRILPQMLVDTTLTHPYGGAMHADTLTESCLAKAELMIEDTLGIHQTAFKSALSASIGIDKALDPDFYGYDFDNSDAKHRDRADSANDRRIRGTSLVTYNSNLS